MTFKFETDRRESRRISMPQNIAYASAECQPVSHASKGLAPRQYGFTRQVQNGRELGERNGALVINMNDDCYARMIIMHARTHARANTMLLAQGFYIIYSASQYHSLQSHRDVKRARNRQSALESCMQNLLIVILCKTLLHLATPREAGRFEGIRDQW